MAPTSAWHGRRLETPKEIPEVLWRCTTCGSCSKRARTAGACHYKDTASDCPRCDRSIEANGGRAARDAEHCGAPSEAIVVRVRVIGLGAVGFGLGVVGLGLGAVGLGLGAVGLGLGEVGLGLGEVGLGLGADRLRGR